MLNFYPASRRLRFILIALRRPEAPTGWQRGEDGVQGVWINSRTTRALFKTKLVLLSRELGVDLHHSTSISHGLVEVGLGNGDLPWDQSLMIPMINIHDGFSSSPVVLCLGDSRVSDDVVPSLELGIGKLVGEASAADSNTREHTVARVVLHHQTWFNTSRLLVCVWHHTTDEVGLGPVEGCYQVVQLALEVGGRSLATLAFLPVLVSVFGASMGWLWWSLKHSTVSWLPPFLICSTMLSLRGFLFLSSHLVNLKETVAA